MTTHSCIVFSPANKWQANPFGLCLLKRDKSCRKAVRSSGVQGLDLQARKFGCCSIYDKGVSHHTQKEDKESRENIAFVN